VSVTQADRDTAGNFADAAEMPAVGRRLRAGQQDGHSFVRIAARHRLANTETALADVRVPDGWKLVPVKLSDDMHEAVVKLDFTSTHDPLWPEYWSAMLAASPECPQAASAEVREAAENALMYLQTGFVECQKCGAEVATDQLDATLALADVVSPARETALAAVSAHPPIDAGEGGVDMLLNCPKCGVQHVDEPSEGWDNPPHRSHLCLACGCIWRPADVPTNGVAVIATAGSADTYVPTPPDLSTIGGVEAGEVS
jgi:DNA-directed RNA polymerase subunit M/transcription elongation factor TFIIS